MSDVNRTEIRFNAEWYVDKKLKENTNLYSDVDDLFYFDLYVI